MGVLLVCIVIICILPLILRGRSIDARHPMTDVERDYWNRRCAAGDGRSRTAIIADLDDPRFLHTPAPSRATVEAPPAPPVAKPATVTKAPRPPARKAPVAPPVTPPAVPSAAPKVSDVPGLRSDAPKARKADSTPGVAPEDAPPFTGCKDHPVTRSGYCTRCAECEDTE